MKNVKMKFLIKKSIISIFYIIDIFLLIYILIFYELIKYIYLLNISFFKIFFEFKNSIII